MITTNYAGNAFSAAFLAAVAKPMVGYTAKLYYNGSALTCDIMRLDLTLGSCADPQGDSDFAVGEVYTSYLEGTLYNVSGSLAGEELDVCIGVDVGSGVYEYAQVATVVVTSAKTRAGVTAFQAAGKLAYEATNTPIGTSGELAPSAVASAISTATGLTVTIGAFASTSTTVTIESGMTCRAALGAIAKRLGGYACETNVGGVAIVPFSSVSTYTLDPGTSTKLPDVEEADFAVDGITVRADEADYTSGTGRVVIEDASATATTEAVTWGNINGYAFRPGSANTAVLDPRITPFDVLAVTHEGNTVNLPARGIAATYDGGYFGTFSAVGLTDAGEDALVRGPLGEKVDLAQRAANEAMEVAEATNQHFWPYTDGVHVTGPETQDEFLAAEAASFPDYDPDTKPYHNILMNALGILLRTALNNLVSITRSAIAFFDGNGNASSNIVASFGSSCAQIGRDGESHVEIDYHSLQLIDKEGDAYFHVSDLRDADGNITDTWISDGTTQEYHLSVKAVTPYTVKYDGQDPPMGYAPFKQALYVRFQDGKIPASGVVVTAIYQPDEEYESLCKAYTLGVRAQNKNNGIHSVVEGYNADASGMYSHAAGYGTVASGDWSNAENQNTQASGDSSHAEGVATAASGIASHAQNYSTVASGDYSHAGGSGSTASGGKSFAHGSACKASSSNQAVFGKYNVEDTNDTYALIVGNGTADNARSNALAVQWDGTMELAAAMPIASGGSGDTGIVTSGGTSATAINAILTAASGWTISECYFVRWGKVGQLYVTCKCSSAISIPANGDISPDITMFTVNEGYRPRYNTFWNSFSSGAMRGTFNTGGGAAIARGEATGTAYQVAANTSLTIRFPAYILA